MKDFQGKVAVVTGAASGIGRALALAFASRGMRLVLSDIEPEPLEAVRREVESLGTEALARTVDVADRMAVRALADGAFERFGAVHVLCNNAGVAVGGALQEARHEDWQWVLGVNLWGVIHGIEAFVLRMIAQGLGDREQPGGHVVNTASMAGLIASQGLGIYNTSKAAVVSLSETLAKDLRDTGIGVSVLCPMGVRTRINESERNRPAGSREQGPAEEPPPLLGRWISPEEVATRVMDAIERNRLYVPTHYEGREHWERRCARISSAFPSSP